MNLSLASARDALLSGLFGDAAHAVHRKAHLSLDMLSVLLPFRFYEVVT
ncbi:MAG: hypothetical protein AAGF33_03280 [Pseudomonadota bacterium]